MFNLREKGMMLITIVMLVFLLVMLTVSMTVIVSESLNITGRAELKAKALNAAEAGIEYAYYQLNNESRWGDPSFNAIFFNNITESIGNNQEFTIIFDSNSAVYSRNNLDNPSFSGTTPGYSAEIICEGKYKDYSQKIRALIVREEMVLCPVVTEGPLNMTALLVGGDMEIYSEKAQGHKGPARLHSNSEIMINFPMGLDLYEGFISSSTSSISVLPSSAQVKGDVPSMKIPDMDITGIIAANTGPTCVTLPDDTFYVVGFFEYENDPLEPAAPYCIPHSAPSDRSADPEVHHDYQIGVASFYPETSCTHFLNNYGDFYNAAPRIIPCVPLVPIPPSCAPALDPNRNFYDSSYGYTLIDFREYPEGGTTAQINAFNAALINETGMSMDYSGGQITLTLERDIYVNSTNGFFETDYIWEGLTGGYFFPVGMDSSGVELNMNGHNILGNKFYLGIPATGTGAIISEETIDYIHTCEEEVSLISEKSVRMVIRDKATWDPYDVYIVTEQAEPYNGIVYAKDDIIIQDILPGLLNLGSWKIKGAFISADRDPDNCTTSPMAENRTGINSDSGICIPPPSLVTIILGMDIIHTYDGLDRVASLRGTDFKVRKQFCELLN